jgi:prolipoprotein diacylglyceryltransferase
MLRVLSFALEHEIPIWLIAQAVALVVATVIARRGLERELHSAHANALALVFAFGTIVGAMILGPILRLPRALVGGADLLAQGWVMAYGAILGGPSCVALFARFRGIASTAALDALASPVGALVAIGRCGCLVAGCDFGAPSSAVWAVAYPPGTFAYEEHVRALRIEDGASQSLSVHPTQAYEVILGVAMISVAVILRRAHAARFIATLSAYALGRFFIEFLRDDPRPMVHLGSIDLSLAQGISVAILGFAAYTLIGKNRVVS